MTKICTKCGHDLPVEMFYTRKDSDGYHSACKTCEYDRSRHRIRATNRGISTKDWNILLESQNHCCAICKEPFGTKEAHYDHNHKTGQKRAALCGMCNCGLGYVHENTAILRAMIDYIEKWNKQDGE